MRKQNAIPAIRGGSALVVLPLRGGGRVAHERLCSTNVQNCAWIGCTVFQISVSLWHASFVPFDQYIVAITIKNTSFTSLFVYAYIELFVSYELFVTSTNFQLHSVSLTILVLIHLLIHFSTHLCHHPHSRHPSLLHSFTPGSKPSFSTNPFHRRFLFTYWTASR